ncbi:hypothetical protein JI739_07370 [Ramlibacter sp. AW1]|uniref:Uncharacterized protein n=1 Tax=Ramlibacter aurantiacus TaxID=2801330 RepID=A0A936ZT67_9BURK|nr:hypothetical protein [Ramlibacter aurantiacus]
MGRSTSYAYDARGQLIASGADLAAPERRYGYNDAGDLQAITDALGNQTRIEHDAVGRSTSHTNPLGYSTQLDYNRRDQLTQRTDALGQPSTLRYDEGGRVSEVANAAGVVIERYRYDEKGSLTERVDAVGAATRYAWDELRRLTSITDRKGQTTSIGYTADGRVEEIRHADGSVQTHRYDALGRIAESAEPASRWSYTWDELDRLAATTHTTAAGKLEIRYSYSLLDRVTRREVLRDGTPIDITDYAYDKLGRLIEQRTKPLAHSGVGEQVTRWQWDNRGRLIERQLPNGIVQRFTHDAASRLTQLAYTRPDGSVIEQIDYQYDPAGQRIGRTLLNGSSKSDTPMQARYDSADRLLELTTLGKTWAFEYDANGSLMKRSNVADPAEQTTYQWDSRNRLIGLLRMPQNVQASYSYDAGGRRIARTITVEGQARSTQYVYEGLQAIGEVRDGRIAATLLTGIGLDDVIARIVSRQGQAPMVRTHITDALGSVLALTREDQSVEAGYAYSPYGETAPVGGDASENTLQYTGRENDEGTGLYFYRARYYDPVIGRFISRDPIGLEGGPNEFAYVGGRPLSYTDPDGLNPVAGAWGGAVAGTAFGPVGTVAGGIIGAGVGAWVGWNVFGPMLAKPPENAYDPNGPKAPGKPTEADGFKDPKGGENWVPNPNPGKGGSGWGWQDAKGDVWCPTGQGGRGHGGPHWDVQTPGGDYRNVKPRR